MPEGWNVFASCFFVVIFATIASPWVGYGLRMWRSGLFSPWLLDVHSVVGKVYSVVFTLLNIFLIISLLFLFDYNRDLEIICTAYILYLPAPIFVVYRAISNRVRK